MTTKAARSLRTTSVRILVLIAVAGTMFASCTATNDGSASLTLVAYDSFVLPDGAFDEFTKRTGIEVEIAIAGDTGELAAKATLTSGNPEGDVLWGIDNTFLSRLVDAEVFDPYVSTSAPIDPSRVEAGSDVVTPVDFGYVCVNFDVEALDRDGIEPPVDFVDLTRPEFRGKLVVPDPTSSSPGLAFLLATVAAFGEGWTGYWRDLMDNDLSIVEGWTEAYYTHFSRHGGDRPLVLSYSTSPPAEVLFADPPLAPTRPAPTGVATGTCFEQIEFAGVLRGTDRPSEARELVDFLVSRSFQELLPENLFVYPVNSDAIVPSLFLEYSTAVDNAWTMSPAEISRRRTDLLADWTVVTGS